VFRLRTFGGLGIEGNEALPQDFTLHRKALALLALVAVHEVVGRERLMALLWPESSAERARGSMKQTVHVLRRQLAAPDLLLGTAELRLNPHRVDSDVGLFLDALARGDAAAAVELYRGPFLDGVHLEGAEEFERWVESQRQVLARRHREALLSLARGAAAGGHMAEAVEWYRRLHGVDPLDTPVALELMDALERVGDRAGALRHARVHEVLLLEELGLSPDPALALKVEALRSGGAVLAEDAAGDTAPPPPTPVVSTPPGPPDPVVMAQSDLPDPPARQNPPSRGDQRLRPLLAAGLAAGVLAGMVLFLWLARGQGPVPPDPEGGLTGFPASGDRTSVAVLPFVDMSPDGDMEHWADGISEEILNHLAGIPGLRVPARTSSFHFKGRNVPVREIAERLGVDHVVEGSLRVSGSLIRVTAQLIDARDDRHLWSSTFNTDPGDVFAVQAEIARTVAQALRVEFDLPPGGPGGPSAPGARAHELYLRGLFHWHRRSTPDLLLALRHFEEATELEPDFARAWAGLSLVVAVLPITFVPPLPVEVARARLEEVAERALALDPSLAEVHAALGLGYHFDWRWEEAEQAFLRALELNPGLPTAHQWYAEHLAKTGRADEARAAMERALELDPLSLVIRSDQGLVHFLNRDFARARASWLHVLSLDPTFILPHFMLHRLDLLEGDLAGAEEWGRRWAALTGAATVEEITLLTRAAGDPALRPEARELLDRWEAAPGARWHDLAFYRTQVGDMEGAIRVIARGVEERAPMMIQLVTAPWFDPFREDPGFQALLAQVAPWAVGEVTERPGPGG